MSTTTPKRQLVLEAIKARLERITIPNGFRTNLGDFVHLEEVVELGPDDPGGVLAILVGDEVVSNRQMEKLQLDLPVEIHVLVPAAPDCSWFNVEAGIADVKQAIELEDRYLGNLAYERMRRGAVRTREREAGSSVIGAVVPYLVPITEVWGAPES